MHNGGALSLAAIIALILLGCGKRRGVFLAILVVLAVLIVCGCGCKQQHHHC